MTVVWSRRVFVRIAYLEDQTTELQEGLKQVRDSLSRTLNTTDIIQVSH